MLLIMGALLDTSRVNGRIMAPKEVDVLIPETCEYVTIHGKIDFANQVKLRALRWGGDLVLFI